ncbi:MAG: hypothetical protein JSC189_001136 [Candidatus Tokpelaia sp. JSC189]|nr:MAG: hypothetical protein JSC189_001136 [Candidatus Tokpelaia sp. JSC189]
MASRVYNLGSNCGKYYNVDQIKYGESLLEPHKIIRVGIVADNKLSISTILTLFCFDVFFDEC